MKNFHLPLPDQINPDRVISEIRPAISDAVASGAPDLEAA